MFPPLLVVGASARAAAHSAVRAGFAPTAIDLFADRDLASVGPVTRVEPASYPRALPEIAGGCGASPWLYTGALENHPGIVDEIAGRRPLWGNPGATLRAVRDPIRLAAALACAGLPAPGVRLSPSGLPRDGSWLVKPLASSAGHGIAPLSRHGGLPAKPHYYQERIEGLPMAAIFLGTGRSSRLLGATRQLLGRSGAPFAYAGSLGPWPLPTRTRQTLHRIGQALADGFGLVGLFGVDFVLRGDVPWPVEVNPRYTASVEVLERATGQSFLRLHASVFEPEPDPAPARESSPLAPSRHPHCGKAILHAEDTFEFPDSFELRTPRVAIDGTTVADVPQPGTRLSAGDPILTVFARGGSPSECARKLAWLLDRWRRRCHAPRPGGMHQTIAAAPT